MTDIYDWAPHNQLSRVNTLWGKDCRAQTYEKSAIMCVCVCTPCSNTHNVLTYLKSSTYYTTVVSPKSCKLPHMSRQLYLLILT